VSVADTGLVVGGGTLRIILSYEEVPRSPFTFCVDPFGMPPNEPLPNAVFSVTAIAALPS
jgi:hypothetical protein